MFQNISKEREQKINEKIEVNKKFGVGWAYGPTFYLANI